MQDFLISVTAKILAVLTIVALYPLLSEKIFPAVACLLGLPKCGG